MNKKEEKDEIETIYSYPWSVYKHYFPEGTKEEFNQAFVSFDVSEEEFKELVGDRDRHHVCWDTVIFDLSVIKTPLNKDLNINNIPNKFRQERI